MRNFIAPTFHIAALLLGLNNAFGDCNTGDPHDVMVTVGPWCVDKYEALICDRMKVASEAAFRSSCITPSAPNDNNGSDSGDAHTEGNSQLPTVIDHFGKVLQAGYRAYSFDSGAAAGTEDSLVAGKCEGKHCDSQWGVSDLLGKNWEWDAAPAGDRNHTPAETMLQQPMVGTRGGSYNYPSIAPLSAYSINPATLVGSNLTFRCGRRQ